MEEGKQVWQLDDSGKTFTSVKKGKRKKFRGLIKETGLYVLFVELVKEIAVKTAGVSTLSRYVSLQFHVSPMDPSQDSSSYEEKGEG